MLIKFRTFAPHRKKIDYLEAVEVKVFTKKVSKVNTLLKILHTCFTKPPSWDCAIVKRGGNSAQIKVSA